METQMKQSGFGIASLVLGIVGILLSCVAVGIFPSIIGLILAIVGLVVKNRKKGLAIAGLICSIVGIIFFFFASSLFSSIFSDDEEDKNVANKVDVVSEMDEPEQETDADTEPEETQQEFYVGDIVETENLRISFLSAGEYTSDNEFIQPKEGNVFYRMEFEFENISDSDQTISSMIDWECYADDYSVEQSWIGDNQIDATLSPGKKVKGAVYFEVPADAESVILEYETNFWTENKISFVVK